MGLEDPPGDALEREERRAKSLDVAAVCEFASGNSHDCAAKRPPKDEGKWISQPDRTRGTIPYQARIRSGVTADRISE